MAWPVNLIGRLRSDSSFVLCFVRRNVVIVLLLIVIEVPLQDSFHEDRLSHSCVLCFLCLCFSVAVKSFFVGEF